MEGESKCRAIKFRVIVSMEKLPCNSMWNNELITQSCCVPRGLDVVFILGEAHASRGRQRSCGTRDLKRALHINKQTRSLTHRGPTHALASIHCARCEGTAVFFLDRYLFRESGDGAEERETRRKGARDEPRPASLQHARGH